MWIVTKIVSNKETTTILLLRAIIKTGCLTYFGTISQTGEGNTTEYLSIRQELKNFCIVVVVTFSAALLHDYLLVV